MGLALRPPCASLPQSARCIHPHSVSPHCQAPALANPLPFSLILHLTVTTPKSLGARRGARSCHYQLHSQLPARSCSQGWPSVELGRQWSQDGPRRTGWSPADPSQTGPGMADVTLVSVPPCCDTVVFPLLGSPHCWNGTACPLLICSVPLAQEGHTPASTNGKHSRIHPWEGKGSSRRLVCYLKSGP